MLHHLQGDLHRTSLRYPSTNPAGMIKKLGIKLLQSPDTDPGDPGYYSRRHGRTGPVTRDGYTISRGYLPTYNILGLRIFNEDVWPEFPDLF